MAGGRHWPIRTPGTVLVLVGDQALTRVRSHHPKNLPPMLTVCEWREMTPMTQCEDESRGIFFFGFFCLSWQL